MSNRLKTPHVFLDTEVFVSGNFQFNSGRFNRLADLCQDGIISVYLTDITKREIEANISNRIRESTESVDKFKSKARVLRNIPSFKAIFEFNVEEVTNELLKQFNDFLELIEANIIPTQNVSVELIFEKYFNQQPPFGEGKKKSEFPDAFSVATIEKWCQTNQQYMYVISNDGDISSACSPDSYLLPLAKLDELFEIIIYEDEYISQLAPQLFEEVESNLKNDIIYEFENSGFILTDHYKGEVSSVNVDDVDLLDKSLVNIEEDTLYFEVTTKISFSAEVSYPDPDFTYYDKEEGKYIYFDYIHDTVQKSIEVPVEVEISFNRKEPHDPEVVSVNLEVNSDIYISLDDVYPYK